MLSSLARVGARSFHSSRISFIAAGETIPSIDLQGANPKDKVNIADALKGKKAVLVTVPGAFTSTCNDVHVPGYVKHVADFKNKGYDVIVVTANDSFVVAAWAKTFGVDGKIRFLADPEGKLAKALNLELEAIPVFGSAKRFQRTAIVIDNGVVKSVNVETDGTVTKSAAANILKQI